MKYLNVSYEMSKMDRSCCILEQDYGEEDRKGLHITKVQRPSPAW